MRLKDAGSRGRQHCDTKGRPAWAREDHVALVRRLLRGHRCHCGLWPERSPRAPPQPGLALVPTTGLCSPASTWPLTSLNSSDGSSWRWPSRSERPHPGRGPEHCVPLEAPKSLPRIWPPPWGVLSYYLSLSSGPPACGPRSVGAAGSGRCGPKARSPRGPPASGKPDTHGIELHEHPGASN